MLGSTEIIVIVVLLALVLVPAILFYVSLMGALQACQPKNRTMDPGLVWLNLIPFFGLGWIFYTVVCISNSLKNEFQDRGIDDHGQYGFGVGIAFSVCSALSIIPFVGLLTGIASLVLFIIYWVQVVGFKNQLIESE